MTTIRVKKDARYFSASNEPFNDKRLSWEARGLMGYLLSKPNDWEVRMNDLEEQGPAGNHKLRRMLAELRKYGYMNSIRLKVGGGKFDWITEVYESPSQNPKPQKAFAKSSSGGKSTSGSTTSGKLPDIVNTESVLKVDENLAFITTLYEKNIGLVYNGHLADELQEYSSFPREWLERAFKEAADANARNWRYVRKCLDNWKAAGKIAFKKEDPKPKSSLPKFDENGRLIYA